MHVTTNEDRHHPLETKPRRETLEASRLTMSLLPAQLSGQYITVPAIKTCRVQTDKASCAQTPPLDKLPNHRILLAVARS